MNADRRQRLEQIRDELNALIEEEQTAMENLPDSFQLGEQGDKMQEAIDAMENAVGEIESVLP